MKKHLLLFFIICSVGAKAQISYKKSVVYAGIEQSIGINSAAEPLPVIKYGITYARFFDHKKFSLETTLSYINHYKREQAIPYNYYYLSDQSQRFTVDFALLYSALKTKRHLIRIGVGPTIWHQKNGFARNELIELEADGRTVSSISFERITKFQSALGFNLTGVYDFIVIPNLVVGVKGSISGNVISTEAELGTLNNSMPTVGARIGYSF